MYLHFPDLDPGATFKPEKLQIGYCYMPPRRPEHAVGDTSTPKTDIVRPLRVRNVTDRMLFLSCIPNLKKQCFVYADALAPAEANESMSTPTIGDDLGPVAVAAAVAHRSPVVDLPLLPQSETTLYIGLRPVLPNEAYITG